MFLVAFVVSVILFLILIAFVLGFCIDIIRSIGTVSKNLKSFFEFINHKVDNVSIKITKSKMNSMICVKCLKEMLQAPSIT